MSNVAYIILHVTGTSSSSPRENIVGVASSESGAENFVLNSYTPQLEQKVRLEWAGSSEETIADYLPRFVKDNEFNTYNSHLTSESIKIQDYDMMD